MTEGSADAFFGAIKAGDVSSVKSMVSADPLYRPEADDIPPRMRTAIAEARKRMLPGILQQKYKDSKAAFDKQDFMQAASGFREMLDGLAAMREEHAKLPVPDEVIRKMGIRRKAVSA